MSPVFKCFVHYNLIHILCPVLAAEADSTSQKNNQGLFPFELLY